MKRAYPSQPLASVLAVVERDGRFLLVCRARPPMKGRWGFPGGVIELGESVAEAARRELAEETGILAQPGAVIDVFDVIEKDEDGKVRRHYILIAVACRFLSGEARPGDDALRAQWFRPEEIEDAALPTVPDLARLMRLALPPTAPDGADGPACADAGPPS